MNPEIPFDLLFLTTAGSTFFFSGLVIQFVYPQFNQAGQIGMPLSFGYAIVGVCMVLFAVLTYYQDNEK